MANNVAASMKASIIIDKKEIISSALSAYAEAQKEIAGNKIELLVDVSDDKARERLKEISKELAGKDYVIKFKNQGIEETMKSLDELFGRIKDVINLSNGLGTTSSPIIDVKDSTVQIDKLQNKLDELSKKYDELSRKKIGSSILGKDIDLVDNEEFKRLSKEFAVLKQELSDVKIHMELFEQSAMSYDSFIPYENKISELSGRIEKLTDDYRELAIVQKNMENNKPISLRNDVATVQDKITDQIVENEERKQKAYKATTDAVMYHAGVVSKLNKAETNGRFYGSNRGTGYFGTGHYFVDSATKHELDNNSSYSKLPYTSIDISQYDNLFKATTNELASGLHNFLENLTRFTQGSDSNTVSELFSQFQKVFGETVMDMQEFDATLEKLKVFMQNSSMDDRSDSVSTQFMKSLGYGGVDTRGTRYADTRYGTVIYDLKEESILQSNITDELQKQGQMLEKINYEKGQVFDQKEDTRIQGILDQQARAKEINAEFDKLFDSTKIKQLESELDSVNNTLKKNEEIIADCQKGISNADAEARKFAKEMKSFGLDVPESEIAEQADRYRSGYQERIDGLQKERPLLEARRQELEENLETEYKLANAAKERAKAIVEERYTPIKDTFQGDKIEQATTSAKELDKTLEQAVDVPTDKFDEILSKLDLTESKLGKIAKITKQMHIDENGKPVESYTLKDKYGSTEIYGESSSKATKQLLSANYVEYDSKQAEKEAKELLVVEKEITKEIEKQEKAQASAQKKKWQAFENEQKKYVSDQKKTTDIEKNKSAYQELLDTIKQYSEVSKRIAKNETLDGDLELAQKLENKISELQKNPILSSSQIAKSERDLVNLFNQLDTLEKKTTKKQSDKSNAQSAKEQAEAWEKNLKAIQEYMDANTKLNNLMAKDKGTGKHASDIARQEKEVEKLKESAIEARVALSSMVNPHETPIDDWRKWVEAMEKFEQATKGSAESVAKLEDALRSAREVQLSSIDSTISGGQSKLDEFSARKDQSDAYKNSLKELGETLERLRTLRASLSNTRAFTDEERNQVDDLTQSIRICVNEISRMSADEKGSNSISRFKLLDRIAEYMKKNTRMSREFKVELESLMDTLRNGGANVQTGKILTQFEEIKDRIRQAKQEGISFFDIFKNKAIYGAAARLAQYYLSFYDFIRYARYAVQSVIEFDTALTEMRKVSDESISTLERLQKATFDLADGVGTTALELQKSIADFMRIGESLKDATKSAQDANVLFRVSEFDDVTQATDALVAMSAAYKDLEKSQINDVLNEIGNNYAISTDELASALQKSAATLSVAGNDIYEAAALVTAGNTVLQDADSVGTGLKMISLRILGTQEAKDELASLGENVDDFVVQTKSKIDQTVRNYTAVASNAFKGISVLDDNGNYRSTYEILRDISKVYQEIIETDKKAGTNRGQALLEVLAGKNRSNVAASILQSPEILESAYESALNSAGSAQEELNKYLESAEAKVQKLKNQLQEFWNTILDSSTLKTIVGGLTTILEKATELVDTIGLLGTVGLGVGLFKGIKNIGREKRYPSSNMPIVI